MLLVPALLINLAACTGGDVPNQVLIAVASNFTETARILAVEFEGETGIRVTLASGSTGKHYAQILHGAPFDIFLAADQERPEKLELEGRAVHGTRMTYALGKLVLWSPDPHRVDPEGRVLQQEASGHLAVANEELAPYGRAAGEVLAKLGVEWTLVRGENVAQAFQFAAGGGAELSLVALSQVTADGTQGSYWVVPDSLYSPILQQAVLLEDSPAARGFMAFLASENARGVIRRAGYGVP